MWPTPPEWKTEVLRLMDEKRISRADLSRLCKVSDAAITVLFREETATSRLVPQVHRALGLVPPKMMPITLDKYRQHLEMVWEDLTEDDKRLLIDTALKISLKRK